MRVHSRDLIPGAPVDFVIVSAEWTRNDTNIGPAAPIPEPESLVLFASRLLSFPLGAKLICRKQRK